MNKGFRFISLKFFVFLTIGLFVLAAVHTESAAAKPYSAHIKISSRLSALSSNPDPSKITGAYLARLGLAESGPLSLMKDEQGRVMVYIRMNDLSVASVAAVKSAGASIVHVAPKYMTITAFISLDRLTALAAVTTTANIVEVLNPARRQTACPTAITSEGDTQLLADRARQLFGLDGSGVTVGVMSDSYNQLTSPTSAADDIASGDLPGAANPCGRSLPVNLVEENAATDGHDEGRAMLQIVHDLAPGAALAFATANNGLFSFAENIVKLRNQAKADIIVDDISYSDEPFFQDGPVSVAIEQVTLDGALYFTSAGNSNILDESGLNVTSYETPAYRPVDCPTVYVDGAVADPPESCHNFSPDGTVPYQEFTLAAGGTLELFFQWAEPWYGVTTDLDIVLIDADGNALASGNNANTGENGTQWPTEDLTYTNETGSTQTYRFLIAQEKGQGTPRIKYQSERSSGIISTGFNSSNSSDTFGPSIMGHAGCKQALSIAAVPYNDANTAETFTTEGPFTLYFEKVSGETPAAPLSSPEVRQKPDVTATDGGANTFFGQWDGSAYRFYGTSASAPHAAAVAALIRHQYLKKHKIFALNQQRMENILKQSASEIENGSQNSIGQGLIDAVDAIGFLDRMGSTSPFAPLLLSE